MAFDMSFTNKGQGTIKKLARDEKMINYGNLIFETGNPNIKNFDLISLKDLVHCTNYSLIYWMKK